MAVNKLNKTFESKQVLTALEMNQITGKIDELVDGVNTNASNIPDVSGFITTADADKKYLPKGQYATTSLLNNKLDTSTYTSDKATFATKEQIGDIETILDNIIGG